MSLFHKYTYALVIVQTVASRLLVIINEMLYLFEYNSETTINS